MAIRSTVTCGRLSPPGEAKPTVVLVHGAWADASSWSAEVATLQAAGYDARAIANPLQDLTTDSGYVADYLKAIHGPIVLVGHFANDLPVSEARTLWASQRGASTAAFGTPSKKAAWQAIPSWYFISSGDRSSRPPPSS